MKRKITAADRNHIHHYFLSKGYSHFLGYGADYSSFFGSTAIRRSRDIKKPKPQRLVFSADTYFILIAKKSFLPT